MSDIQGVKVWTSAHMPSDRVLSLSDLEGFQDQILRGGRATPDVVVMGPRTFERFKDFELWLRACVTTGQVGPWEPITVRGTWKAAIGALRTLRSRLRRALHLLRHGYDPEDL